MSSGATLPPAESGPPRGGDLRALRRAVGFAFLLGVGLLVVVYASKVLFVIFAGILFSIFLSACSHVIAKWTHLPYRAVVALLVITGIGATALGLFLIGPSVAEQATRLSQELPRALESVWQRIVEHVHGITPPAPRELAPEPRKLLTGARDVVSASTEIVGGLAAVFFLGVYGAFQPGAFSDAAVRLVPVARRARAREVWGRIGAILGRWLVGRAVAMAFVGVATAVGLHLLKVPLAISLGLLAGLLAFVEYVGAIVSAVPPIVFALAQSPIEAVWVVVLFTGVHIVEGYFLTPLLARKAVLFPPAFTLAMQLLLGALFGVIGLTFATPLAVVVVTLVRMLYVEDTLGDRG